jgi:prepilin-type N-terminal cleavage/methylation domain-containing protein/prepilin-type processing-associated H-X9-DG protein
MVPATVRDYQRRPDVDHYKRLPRRHGLTLVELLITLACISVLFAIAVPAIMMARDTASRMSCRNRGRQISLAIHSYADYCGLTPGNGDDGRPWPVLICPWVENAVLDELLRTSVNAGAERYVQMECPSDGPSHASIAPLKRGAFSQNPESAAIPLATVSDGLSQTLAATEVGGEVTLPWISGPTLTPAASNSSHGGRLVTIVWLDGHVISIPNQDVGSEVWSAWARPNDGQ